MSVKKPFKNTERKKTGDILVDDGTIDGRTWTAPVNESWSASA